MNENKYKDLEIVYEDDFILAINKPSGIHSVMIPENPGPSIAQKLADADQSFTEISTKTEDSGLINRIDFHTSGILIAGKTKEAWLETRANLLSESVFKSYLACVEGKLEDIVIENYIGTPNRRAAKVKVYKKEPKKKDRALPANTEIKVLSHIEDKDVSFIRAIVHAGRRHQIRAHSGSINHPLVGDDLYGSSRNLSEVLGFDAPHFFLHAERIKFIHPITKELIDIHAPIPTSFAHFIPSES